jgi:hypothetical protein
MATPTIPSVMADAARVSVSEHTIHVELAMSTHDGAFQPVLRLALSREVASELAALLDQSIEQAKQLRRTPG